ncbi:MAG TPA: hypothetical protein ENF70_01865 [Deltaproteobacteria bacterium]|nr:hypothetical protein [Desulfobacterales bacterium]HDH97867.1 hypothetical protein [Deltaproteobacteria bacterium]
MNGQDQFLGIVQSGQFQILTPTRQAGRSLWLTRMGMQVSASPESEEIELDAHEGKAIMVRGLDSGDWLYSAEVIDEAGPILTVMVQRVIGTEHS